MGIAGAWGYRDDGDAGLLHVGARYYDPQVGRFISRDVVLSEHPYLYCDHDPVNEVDPSGRIPDITGWLGRQLQLDFNFTKDDWNQIADGIDRMANFEIGFGGALLGIAPTLDRLFPPPEPRPSKRPPIWVPGRGWYRPPVRPRVPPRVGIGPIGDAVGFGLIVGGGVAKGIAWMIRELSQ